MPQLAFAVFTCADAVGADAAARQFSLDGIRVRNARGAAIIETGTYATTRNAPVEGNLYRWNATSTAAANGTTVVIPFGQDPTEPGRWLLVLPGGGVATSSSAVKLQFISGAGENLIPNNDVFTPATQGFSTLWARGTALAASADGAHVEVFLAGVYAVHIAAIAEPDPQATDFRAKPTLNDGAFEFTALNLFDPTEGGYPTTVDAEVGDLIGIGAQQRPPDPPAGGAGQLAGGYVSVYGPVGPGA